MDAVAIGSILSVVISLVILVYLGIKLKKLMDNTHSED
jgi:hypothetical protein